MKEHAIYSIVVTMVYGTLILFTNSILKQKDVVLYLSLGIVLIYLLSLFAVNYEIANERRKTTKDVHFDRIKYVCTLDRDKK